LRIVGIGSNVLLLNGPIAVIFYDVMTIVFIFSAARSAFSSYPGMWSRSQCACMVRASLWFNSDFLVYQPLPPPTEASHLSSGCLFVCLSYRYIS